MANRILVVEDSDDVRGSYVQWLQGAGYQVTEAADGQQAVEEARRARPDVVLLDINLPDQDGYSLAESFRRDPRMAKVPVIVLSGRTGFEHERRARSAGALIALSKPCAPDMILAAVAGALA